jgi:hypothetical protein
MKVAMGVVAILFVGLLVATVQVVAEDIRRGERVRIYTLALLAAFFGGSLVKAITQEGLGVVSFGSIAVAAAACSLVLYAWHYVARQPQPVRQTVSSAAPPQLVQR